MDLYHYTLPYRYASSLARRQTGRAGVQHKLEYVELYVLAETAAEARARIRSLPDYGLHAENLSTEFSYPCDLDQEVAKSEEIIDPDKVIREFNHRGDELLLIKRLRDTGLNPAQIAAFIVTLDRTCDTCFDSDSGCYCHPSYDE